MKQHSLEVSVQDDRTGEVTTYEHISSIRTDGQVRLFNSITRQTIRLNEYESICGVDDVEYDEELYNAVLLTTCLMTVDEKIVYNILRGNTTDVPQLIIQLGNQMVKAISYMEDLKEAQELSSQYTECLHALSQLIK